MLSSPHTACHSGGRQLDACNIQAVTSMYGMSLISSARYHAQPIWSLFERAAAVEHNAEPGTPTCEHCQVRNRAPAAETSLRVRAPGGPSRAGRRSCCAWTFLPPAPGPRLGRTASAGPLPPTTPAYCRPTRRPRPKPAPAGRSAPDGAEKGRSFSTDGSNTSLSRAFQAAGNGCRAMVRTMVIMKVRNGQA